jgi:hypothetical protein
MQIQIRVCGYVRQPQAIRRYGYGVPRLMTESYSLSKEEEISTGSESRLIRELTVH